MAADETIHVHYGDIAGDWRVERLGGFLPPMVGVWKRVRGDRGETWVGVLPAWPFRVERRRDHVALVYNPPLSMLVDELREQPDGSWIGRSVLGGHELGSFRLVRHEARRRRYEQTRPGGSAPER